MAESLTVQLRGILDAYEGHAIDVMDVALNRVARESVKKLRASSPKKTGSYAKGWALKKITNTATAETVVVHNKTDYQLTHLLENGHRIVNKKGEWGRVNGIKHIKPVEEWASDELPKEIEKELE